jgi:hypothetical protein
MRMYIKTVRQTHGETDRHAHTVTGLGILESAQRRRVTDADDRSHPHVERVGIVKVGQDVVGLACARSTHQYVASDIPTSRHKS